MADSAGNWCLIESDPVGHYEDVQVEEIYSLDDPQLQENVCYGLIFLFKYDKASHSGGMEDIRHVPGLFFAHQIINNACATQAILSILMNTPALKLGQELEQFKEFTSELPPDMKGLAISNSETIRTVHNSFARTTAFAIADERERPDDDDNDLFHFISYIPFQGAIYELDGLKEGPVYHGPFTGNWTDAVKPIIQSRIERYASSEIRFNLMAVIKDRITLFNERLSNNAGNAVELRQRIEDETRKMTRYKKENARRRHNFLPLIMACLELIVKSDAGKSKFNLQ